MPEAFDPYHKWLGIPPEDQPPNHYRLLAINPFESDADVIASAADQRMAHVRTFQTGENSALSQRVLNELSAARVCLLNPDRKAEYDRLLRRQLAPPPRPSGQGTEPAAEAPSVAAGPWPALDGPSIEGTQGSAPRYRLRRKRQLWPSAAALAVAGGLCVVLVAVWLTVRNPGRPASAHSPALPDGNASAQEGEPGVAGGVPPTGAIELPARGEDLPGPGNTPAVAENQPVVPAEQSILPGNELPVRHGKLPAPDINARREAEQRLKEVLVATPPEKLLEESLARHRDDAERFVLLTKAGESAAAAGDVGTALRAVDELARRYEIDAIQMKAETLIKLKEGAKTPEAFRAVAEYSLRLVDQAVAEDRRDLAMRIAPVALAAARKAGDSELVRKATLALVELQTRPPGGPERGEP